MGNDEKNGGGFGGFLSGFVFGLFVGSITALLTAPKSGSETRRIISERSLELQGKAANTIEDVLLQAERALSSARETTEHTIERTKHQIAQLEAQGERMLDEQRQRFIRIVDDIRNREHQV